MVPAGKQIYNFGLEYPQWACIINTEDNSVFPWSTTSFLPLHSELEQGQSKGPH